MISPAVLDRFLATVDRRTLQAATRYAREARVGAWIGPMESPTSVVRGVRRDHDVAFRMVKGALRSRCDCANRREPCRHGAAAALVLRQLLAEGKWDGRGTGPGDDGARQGTEGRGPGTAGFDAPDDARRRALEERRAAARRERFVIHPEAPPFVAVKSPSGFTYRVHLRGAAEGPHSCDCPDFEANLLHTCKHVERVRTWLSSRRSRLPRGHRAEAERPRIYLHFGERVEPRLLGRPSGRGSPAARRGFGGDGAPVRPLGDLDETRRWLGSLGSWVEPEALAWVERRVDRKPNLPPGDFAGLLPPLGLKPYPYQWVGAEFLARTGRALLADEMGLGKTVQAILAAAALRRASRPARSVTVVCPASLRGGWQDEIRRWLGESATLLEGMPPARARTIDSRPSWLITHYEQVLRDHRHHEASPPDLLIIDEAQRAKGLWTRTARTVKTIGARYVFALTGTPLENRLEEAYAIAQLIDQRLLPPLWQLDRDHFVRDENGRRVVLYRDLGALRSRLAPAFLRRRKEDVALDLPERVRSIAMVPLHEAVLGTYEDVISQVARIARKKVLLPADLDRIQRLLVIARRCCNGPHMLGMEAADRKVPKLRELEQALQDLCLGEGRKAVVFSEWTDMTNRVEALARKLRLPVFHLHGGVPIRRRQMLIRAFTEEKGPAVFVSTDAGGLGLNLQAADVVVNLDLPWNPARLEQRVARAHRIGSKGTVQEILLVAEGSIEERILGLHDTKRNVLANVWDKGDQDVIAAPGGSGAFREMVEALLAPRGSSAPGPQRPGTEETAVAAGFPLVDPAAAAGAPDLPAPNRPVGPGDEAPGSPAGEEPPLPGPVDAAALAAAVRAVAPALPAEHRASLALVFRALAESLEEA